MSRRRKISPQTEAVLIALLEVGRRWTYGYELSKRTDLRSGTLYPILMRLCDQGFLEDGWQDAPEPGRPRRHIYRLTAGGLALAKEIQPSRRAASGRGSAAEAVS